MLKIIGFVGGLPIQGTLTPRAKRIFLPRNVWWVWVWLGKHNKQVQSWCCWYIQEKMCPTLLTIFMSMHNWQYFLNSSVSHTCHASLFFSYLGKRIRKQAYTELVLILGAKHNKTLQLIAIWNIFCESHRIHVSIEMHAGNLVGFASNSALFGLVI